MLPGELLPAGGARQREEPATPAAPERDAVHGAGDHPVRPLDAEACRPLEAASRESALDALVVATDVYTWKLLRRDMGRGVVATRKTVAGMVRSVLATRGFAKASSGSDG